MHAENPTLQQIDQIFRPLVTPGSPGLAVIVLKNGDVMFQQGYGLANLETRAAIAPDTDFRLASFTKQFTATCIMLLVHDGKLSYDDTLTKIFPGLSRLRRHDHRAHAADAYLRSERLRRLVRRAISRRRRPQDSADQGRANPGA